MPRPSLTFFCEMDESSLAALFRDGQVLSYLKKMDANLSLGLLDFSDERAGVVKHLNKAGVPVTAWILLPKDQGYWTNLETIDETTQRYVQFKQWQEKHSLTFTAIGLDIEPKIEIMSALNRNPLKQIFNLLRRLNLPSDYKVQENKARALVKRMKADSFAVETYQFPLIVDERAARSQVLSKSLGITSLESDREVLMLYSSFFPTQADSILWSYAKETRAAGVGSTGGGVEIEGMAPLKTMRWVDLKRDLLLASKRLKHVYVFSLEGCVQNGFMERLINIDWQIEVLPPVKQAAGILILRKVIQALLWTLSHPLEVALGILLVKGVCKRLRSCTRR